MPVVFIDGFEGYGTSSTASGLAPFYNSASGTFTVSTGRFSGYALSFGTSAILEKSVANIATMVVGFSFEVTTVATRTILSIIEGSNIGLRIDLNSDGSISVYRQNTLLATSATGLVTNNIWYHLEVKVLTANSGTYEVRLSGVNVVSGSGDTQTGSNAYANAVRFGASGVTGLIIDDFHVIDCASGPADDFIGPQRVITVYPNAAGDDTDFTPGTGSNYQQVDETPADNDSTYVESSTSGHKDLYAFDDISGASAVTAAQEMVLCRETDVTSYSLLLTSRSGSTEAQSSSMSIGSSSYVGLHHVFEVNPDTGFAWTQSNLNAAQFGYEVD